MIWPWDWRDDLTMRLKRWLYQCIKDDKITCRSFVIWAIWALAILFACVWGSTVFDDDLTMRLERHLTMQCIRDWRCRGDDLTMRLKRRLSKYTRDDLTMRLEKHLTMQCIKDDLTTGQERPFTKHCWSSVSWSNHLFSLMVKCSFQWSQLRPKHRYT